MLIIAMMLAQATAVDSTDTSLRDAQIAALSSCRIEALGSSPLSPPLSDNNASWQQQLAAALRIARQNLENAADEESKLAHQKQTETAKECLAQGMLINVPPQPADEKREPDSAS
jgi:hypothetical protein